MKTKIFTIALFLMLTNLAVTAQTVGWDQFGDVLWDNNSEARSYYRVSLSGDGQIMVTGIEPAYANSIGYFQVFKRTAIGWDNIGDKVYCDEPSGAYEFGAVTAINHDGSVIAVSATRGYSTDGYVKVYRLVNDELTQMGSTLYNTSQAYGVSLSLNDAGNILAVMGRGFVITYKFIDNEWQQIGSTIISTFFGDINAYSTWLKPQGKVALNSAGTILAYGFPVNTDNYNDGLARVYSFDGTDWQQMGSDFVGTSEEALGTAVALDNTGNIVAISSSRSNNGTITKAGSTKVYEYNGTTWQQRGNTMYGMIAEDLFGSDLAMSGDGNTLIVSSMYEIVPSYVYGNARVFTYSANEWRQAGQTLFNYTDDYPADDMPLVSISDDGNMLAVGWCNNFRNKKTITYTKGEGLWNVNQQILGSAIDEKLGKGAAMNDAGDIAAVLSVNAIKVYRSENGVYTQIGSDIPNSLLGAKPAIDMNAAGNIFVVGNMAANSGAGLVRVYENISDTWVQKGSDLTGIDDFGETVAINETGDIIATTDFNDPGSVKVYQFNGTDWQQRGTDITPPSGLDYIFESKVDLNAAGDRLVITTGVEIKTFVMEYDGTNWILLGGLISYSAALEPDVAINAVGDIIACGNGYTYVRVYKYDTGANTWNQLGDEIQKDYNSTSDGFGNNIELSNDGYTLGISQKYNNEFGSSIGNVRIYQYDASVRPIKWKQMRLHEDIDGDAENDQFGSGFAMNEDGTVLVVGAHYNDNAASDAGQIKFFGLNSNKDIAVTYIEKPVKDFDNIVVKATVYNNGAVPITEDFPISYSLNGNTVTETFTADIGIYTTIEYTFAQTLDLSEENIHTLRVFSGLQADNNPVNDTLSIQINTHINGNTLVFDGNNDYVKIEEEPAFDFSTTPFTVETWFKITIDKQGDVISKHTNISGTRSGYCIEYSGNQIKAIIGTGGWTSVSDSVNLNQAYHIAMTYNSGTLKMYLDGVLIGIQTGTMLNNDKNLWIGGSQTYAGNYFGGNIDEVRFWNTERTQQEIQDNMNNEINPSSANLVAYYNFNRGISAGNNTLIDIAADMTNNNYHGTLVNFNLTEDNNTSNLVADCDFDFEVPETPTLADLTGECSVTASAPTTTDNCAGTVTGTTTDLTEYTEQGTFTITWTFADGNGNSTTAQQTVIVEDNSNPTITCIANQTVSADNTHSYTVSGTEFDPTATDDNCGVASIVNDFNSSSSLANAQLPEGSTTIVWTVTDNAGNTANCSFDVLVDAYVGISDLSASGISIYPNPTSSFINLTGFNEPVSVKNIEITDITGKTLKSFSNSQISEFSNFEVDLSGFESGIYLIKISNDTNIYTQKIIKK